MADSDGKVRIIIDTNADNASKELDKVSASFDKSGNAAKNASVTYNKVASTLKSLVGAYVGLRGAQMAAKYIMESVEAFRAQEIAVKSLNNALINAGVYSSQYSQQIQNLASEIQSYSNYGDEAVIKAQALGQSFAGQIPITEAATRAVVDFAAATGIDLEQAFALFGKSVGSSTNALARYGVQLQKGMSDEQKMDAITKQLSDRYAGSAKEMSNATVQVQNALGDLSEAFGSLFNTVITDNQNTIKNFVNSWADAINWLKARIGDVSNASISQAQARIRQIYVEQEKIQKRFSEHTATTYDAQRFEQLKNEENQALLRIKNLTKQEEQLQKSQKPIKYSDETPILGGGGGSSKLSGGGSSSVAKIKEEIGAYQQLNDKIANLKNQMLDMIAAKTTNIEAFSELKNQYSEAVAEMENVNKTFSESFKEDFNGIGLSIASSLSSAILTPLSEGETYLQRFGQIGLSITKQIGDMAIKNLLEQISLQETLNAIKAAGKAVSSFFGWGVASANGNVFKNGNVIPFATGGVVSQPTTFPMANGTTGLMGEAGAEAIMPLKRNAEGKLGVEASGLTSNVNIYNYSDSRIETVKRPNGDTDVFIKKVNAALSSERTQSGFSSAMQRNNNIGIQAS